MTSWQYLKQKMTAHFLYNKRSFRPAVLLGFINEQYSLWILPEKKERETNGKH